MRIRMIRNTRGGGRSLAEGQELQVGADMTESDAKVLVAHRRAVVCQERPPDALSATGEKKDESQLSRRARPA